MLRQASRKVDPQEVDSHAGLKDNLPKGLVQNLQALLSEACRPCVCPEPQSAPKVNEYDQLNYPSTHPILEDCNKELIQNWPDGPQTVFEWFCNKSLIRNRYKNDQELTKQFSNGFVINVQ